MKMAVLIVVDNKTDYKKFCEILVSAKGHTHKRTDEDYITGERFSIFSDMKCYNDTVVFVENVGNNIFKITKTEFFKILDIDQ